MNEIDKITCALQKNFNQIRNTLGLSVQTLADYLGTSRQTIHNLTCEKSKLTQTQAISVLALIDFVFSDDSPEYTELQTLLGIDAYIEQNQIPPDSSFLDTWFYLYDIKSKLTNALSINGEILMKNKKIAIIDTSQLIQDPYIIDELTNSDEEIFIPTSVKKELDKLLSRHILEIGMPEKIVCAKRTLQKYKKKITFWQPQTVTFGDCDIMQLVLTAMSDRSVQAISLYTFDKELTHDVLGLDKSKCIIHQCNIQVFQYQNKKKTLTKANITSQISLTDIKLTMYRQNKWIQEFEHNSAIENAPIPTPSGADKVLKFWAWHAQAGDVYRLYYKTPLKEGEKVSINIMTLDNCGTDSYVRLMAWGEGLDPLKSKKIPIPVREWKKLELTIDNHHYQYINLEIIPQRDSQYNGAWNGVDGFVDDFKISR